MEQTLLVKAFRFRKSRSELLDCKLCEHGTTILLREGSRTTMRQDFNNQVPFRYPVGWKNISLQK